MLAAASPLLSTPDPERREPTATGLHRSFDAIRGDIRYRTRSCLLRSFAKSPLLSNLLLLLLVWTHEFYPQFISLSFFRDFLSRKDLSLVASSRFRRREINEITNLNERGDRIVNHEIVLSLSIDEWITANGFHPAGGTWSSSFVYNILLRFLRKIVSGIRSEKISIGGSGDLLPRRYRSRNKLRTMLAAVLPVCSSFAAGIIRIIAAR